MCIICFLTNENQYLLRHSAMLRGDRLEHSLDNYKNEFIKNFTNSKESLCFKHRNRNNELIRIVMTEINEESIEQFFTTLKEVYIHWINAEISTAINKLKVLVKDYLLEQYGEENFTENIRGKVLYRGRQSECFVSHWDMFHIPFNKRFLIKNQRYSLSGQPILYLSSSPYCVYKELGVDDNLKISSFINITNNDFKIFQNVNKFEKYIAENNLDDMIVNNLSDNMINYQDLKKPKFIEGMLYLMILSSCCSFPRRDDTKDAAFSEEYVIPQVLTIVLKYLKFDGIKYTSTKLHIDIESVRINGISDVLYSNYCIFTNYKSRTSKDKSYVYDKKLYKKFNVSSPICCQRDINKELFKIDELFELIDEIDEIDEREIRNFDNRGIIYEIGNTLSLFKDFVDNLQEKTRENLEPIGDNTNIYIIEKFVTMQIVFLRNILLDIENNRE